MKYLSNVLILFLFGYLALKPGEKAPEPTVPVPKQASEKEKQNSVEIKLENMKKSQVNNSVSL